MEVGVPQTLVSLSQPLDSTNGRVLASAIQSVSGSRKRKRSEIATSVDGEGISIHTIQEPRLIASYAVPPQAHFTAAPCSVFHKSKRQRPAQRFTYATTKASQDASTTQLHLFREQVPQNEDQVPFEAVQDLSFDSQVLSIDVLPAISPSDSFTTDHDVVVIHEDGSMDCRSADLAKERWKNSLRQLDRTSGGGSTRVEFASLTEAKSARKGLLKVRQDALAPLNTQEDGQRDNLEGIQVLCLITRQDGADDADRKLHVLSVRQRSTVSITDQRPPIQHLVTLSLPSSGVVVPSKIQLASQYLLHPASGILYHLQSGSITTYDLTGILPRISSIIPAQEAPFESIVRLSPHEILAASSRSWSVYDTKWGAIQNLQTDLSGLSQSRKRKSAEAAPVSTCARLISYVADIGTLVALHNNELISATVEYGQQGKTRKSGLLLNALGRGVQSAPPSEGHDSLVPLKRPLKTLMLATQRKRLWLDTIEKLDQLAADHDIRSFEETLAAYLKISYRKPRNDKSSKEATKPAAAESKSGANPEGKPQVNGVKSDLMNGSAGDDAMVLVEEEEHIASNTGEDSLLQEWKLIPESTVFDVRKQEQVLYALSKIFALRSQHDDSVLEDEENEVQASSIYVRFLPPNVFKWLLFTGNLTSNLVMRALNLPMSPDNETNVSNGLISALIDCDPSMRVLYTTLHYASFTIEETVKAIKILVQSLDNIDVPDAPEQQLLLEAAQANGTHKDSEGTLDEEQIESVTDLALSDLDVAFETLQDGMVVRGHSLRQALVKLHAFPGPRISQALRKELTQHEIIFLVQILRIELADGGWTSRYIDLGPQFVNSGGIADGGAPSNKAIIIISSLLGYALDAIGVGGWLTASSQNPEDSADEMIFSLRAEISAALEGIHEAGFLSAILGDFRMYAEQKRRSLGPVKGENEWKKKIGQPIKVDVGDDDVGAAMLPLGHKAEAPIKPFRLGTGGQRVIKSKRTMDLERSKKLGKYTYEEIRI
ncbi:hypothetical protein K402DRAFT_451602 [Aulographum hederae CBS 113979]|uniref:Utp8 beta-propeller domain-containing protein n=1 Tax=Aulographum hederae CBS 113979 TaxID=1176131 RepID=A0A6G1HAA4_9PEZI|nr:hypothetical protein K402DRAFT_451602 [Aulographum hederae CBS 113979]